MAPELAWMVAIFWIAWKPRLEVGVGSRHSRRPEWHVRGSHLAISLALACRRLLLNA
jgi:hypothetical protein